MKNKPSEPWNIALYTPSSITTSFTGGLQGSRWSAMPTLIAREPVRSEWGTRVSWLPDPAPGPGLADGLAEVVDVIELALDIVLSREQAEGLAFE